MALQSTKMLIVAIAIFGWHQNIVSVSSSIIYNIELFNYSNNQAIERREEIISPLVGGTIAKIGQFPWMVVIHQLLGHGRIAMCAGTILSTKWVLTAGHCIADFPRKFLVVFGETDKANIGYDFYSGPGISMITTQGALHPQYGKTFNDIGLLYMPKNIPLGGVIQSIALAGYEERKETFTGQRGLIVGWGKDGPNSIGSRYLKFGQIRIISNSDCRKSWSINSRIVCTAPNTGRDTCEGDSGGPLLVHINNKYLQIGIISYGDGRCPSSLPGAFTRITSFTTWIKQVTGIQY